MPHVALQPLFISQLLASSLDTIESFSTRTSLLVAVGSRRGEGWPVLRPVKCWPVDQPVSEMPNAAMLEVALASELQRTQKPIAFEFIYFRA